ncbi:MAG: recombinase family protein [Aeriscardovia sp.]|nr:recombinase family protein [Aeriscardovia sp.]MBQ1803349.1 recombinase family protein [Aeriscardovia sp.]
MILGYARVSTVMQDPSLQHDNLMRAGCERIFTDYGSGMNADRPQLLRMLDVARSGDTVVVWKLDRLGRNMKELVRLINLFQERGIAFRSLTEAIDTSTPGGMLTYNIFASIAQFEHDLLVERTAAGMAAARARGRHGGRPPKLSDENKEEICRLYRSNIMTMEQLAKIFDVSKTSLYKVLREKGAVNSSRAPAKFAPKAVEGDA